MLITVLVTTAVWIVSWISLLMGELMVAGVSFLASLAGTIYFICLLWREIEEEW